MVFITLKALKVKQFNDISSCGCTAFESVLNIAGMGAIAPVVIAVGGKLLTAVQACAFILSGCAPVNRFRMFLPPCAAAFVGAEATRSASLGLNDLAATVRTDFGFQILWNDIAVQAMRHAVVAHRVPTDAKFSGDGAVSHLPLAHRLDFSFLTKRHCHVYTSVTAPKVAAACQSVRRQRFACSPRLSNAAQK